MTAVIMNVGRYLGIGDKEVAVTFSALQQQQRDGGQRIVMDATKERLQAAPIFVRHQEGPFWRAREKTAKQTGGGSRRCLWTRYGESSRFRSNIRWNVQRS
jgi:hypothetical protein